MKLKIVIIDDEKKAVEAIKIIIEEYVSNCEVVGLAHSAVEGVKIINKTQPDLVFLDIEMPNNSGFDMLELIPKKTFETVFITAYDQYAIKAIKFSAFDYLLKPISIKSLQDTIAKYLEEKEKRNEERYRILESALHEKTPSKIALTHSKGIQYIELEQILYFSSDRSYITVHIASGSKIVLTNRSLSELEHLLETDFIRVHKSYLVNINHVDGYSNVDGGVVVMANSEEILLSRRKKEQFLDAMKKKLKS